MENNCNISTNDPVICIIYDREESLSLFGPGYVEDMGYYVPEELIQRYKVVTEEFWKIQEEIRKIKYG